MAGSDGRGCDVLRRALATLGLGPPGGVAATAAAPQASEETLQAGDYLLRTRLLQAGTRSEGRIGRLFRHGIEVVGRTPGETIDVATPAGPVRFTYLGEARPRLWSTSGWTHQSGPR